MSPSRTFSEFLVEQGLLTAEDLVQILIEQSRSLPTPAELALEHKVLDAKQLVAVFAQQMKTSADFVKACQDLGFWDARLQSVLTSENDRLRLPIAQLLQKSGKVSTENLVSALDSFLSQNAQPQKAETPAPAADLAPASASAPAPAAEAETVTQENDHFREYYTAAVQARMIALANEWDQSSASTTDALIDRVHGVVGAARFSKLTEIEDLFKTAEANIRALADCATPLPQVAIETFRQELVQIFEKGWALRELSQPVLGAGSDQIEVAV